MNDDFCECYDFLWFCPHFLEKKALIFIDKSQIISA